MSDLVPNGWSSTRFDQFAVLQRGFDLPTQDRVIGAYPIYGSNGIVGYHNKAKVKAAGVVTGRSGSIGDVSFVNCDFWALNTSLYINNFQGNDPKYVFYFLHYFDLSRFSTGTGVPMLNRNDVHIATVIFPPLPEQQKIAKILTSVDEVIEKTQAQINKLKNLKTGMMQELLTRGIGHTEFKDSPVGRIPAEWDCLLLDAVATRGSGHTPDKKQPTYWNGTIKWVSLADSSSLDKLFINDTKKHISLLGIGNSSATLHAKGTVVMTRDAGVGKSAIITEQMAVSQHFMAWLCNEKLNNYFLYYLLQLWKPKFKAIAIGSTIKTIGLPFFKKLYIPVPAISEQLIISNSIHSIDEKIFTLDKKNQLNKNTKKGLMQDLLTGRVRVNTDTTNTEVAMG